MDFKVKEDTYNPLLKRKQIRVEVEHDAASTPSRLDLRKALAAKYNTKPENVFVLDVETRTGTQTASCAIEVYDDPQSAQRTVPKYIQTRNLPPEERKRMKEQEAKKEEAKPEKPKAAEKPKAEKPKEETKEQKPKQEAKPAPATEAPKKGKGSESK